MKPTLAIPLSKRKQQLLLLLVELFIRRMHPISSAEIERYFDVSSATIRNELKELTELGFCQQPHASSGRIPTFLAYRFYVDTLLARLRVRGEEVEALARTFRTLGHELETLLTASLEHLAAKTGYLAYATVPGPAPLILRSVNLIEVGDRQLIFLLVSDFGLIQSNLITSEVPVKKLMLGLLNERLNNFLRGKRLQQVDFGELRALLEDFSHLPARVLMQLEAFLAELQPDSSPRLLFTDASTLLRHPEFYVLERFQSVMEGISDKASFLKTIESSLSEKEIAAIIGEESNSPHLSSTSILMGSYELDERLTGQVGVIGPTRLHYEKALPLILKVARVLSQVLKEWRVGASP